MLVPLHRSGPWIDVVSRNLRTLAPVARVVVSDATGLDDTWERLRARHPDLPVTWLGPRSLEAGWVAHCNDLLARADTELAMWLPHDDDLTADWVTAAQAALDAAPDAVMAVGPLAAEGETGPPRYAVHPGLASPDPASRVGDALRCITGSASALLGMTFRGVHRVDRAVPLPSYEAGGDWCDVLWALEMVARGPVVATEAVYVKRWHAANTHGAWRDRRAERELRECAIPHALRHLDATVRERVLATAWTDEALDQRDRNAELARQVRELTVSREDLARRLRRQRRLARSRAATSSASPSE